MGCDGDSGVHCAGARCQAGTTCGPKGGFRVGASWCSGGGGGRRRRATPRLGGRRGRKRLSLRGACAFESHFTIKVAARGHLVKWLGRTRRLGRVTGSNPVRSSSVTNQEKPRYGARLNFNSAANLKVQGLPARSGRRVPWILPSQWSILTLDGAHMGASSAPDPCGDLPAREARPRAMPKGTSRSTPSRVTRRKAKRPTRLP